MPNTRQHRSKRLKWMLSDVPKTCMSSCVCHLQNVERLHRKTTAVCKLSWIQDNEFEHVNSSTMMARRWLPKPRQRVRKIHLAPRPQHKNRYLQKKVDHLQNEVNLSFPRVKGELEAHAIKAYHLMNAWCPNDNTMNIASCASEKIKAVLRMVQAICTIEANWETKFKKWTDHRQTKCAKKS